MVIIMISFSDSEIKLVIDNMELRKHLELMAHGWVLYCHQYGGTLVSSVWI